MNSLPPILKNQYLVMRHGRSLANEAGLIVSHAENGLHNYGLAKVGRQQVEMGISASVLSADTLIISSDFKRAHETAELVHQRLACPQPVTFDIRLRERNFGELELGPDNRYAEIWQADENTPGHQLHGVETLQSVLKRACSVILDCEQQFNAQNCLLIAHGDILQILQTWFMRLAPAQHRQLPELKTAEVRALLPAAPRF